MYIHVYLYISVVYPIPVFRSETCQWSKYLLAIDTSNVYQHIVNYK